MILAVDVQYAENTAFVAAVTFNDWADSDASGEYHSVVQAVADYEPGHFYKRELPCILKLLTDHQLQPHTIVVDGYVFLDGQQQAGLGKHLYDALGASAAIIGVAKKAFAGIPADHELLRGSSAKPLYITTTHSLAAAKGYIGAMSGQHRIPILLKRADQLCREAAKNHSDQNSICTATR